MTDDTSVLFSIQDLCFLTEQAKCATCLEEGPIPRPATARESNELDRLARKESGRERIEGPVLFLDRSTAR